MKLVDCPIELIKPGLQIKSVLTYNKDTNSIGVVTDFDKEYIWVSWGDGLPDQKYWFHSFSLLTEVVVNVNGLEI